MRITQCYVSKSVSDFPFHTIYSLDDYRNTEEPCVFFGCYRFEDIRIINSHNGTRVVFWTGQDIINFRQSGNDLKEATHVTAHPKVYNMLVKRFGNAQLVRPSTFLNEVKPRPLGTRIYAYCPNNMPLYHGLKVIDELRCAGYEISIGDGQWTQEQWRNGKSDEFYRGVFIGLCLSEFAGGGTSIIEMGLRGIRVVTNVFDLPHTLKWVDAQHIANLIGAERERINMVQKSLAMAVWMALDHEFKWLEI
jgi:hypothetical protein